MSFEEISPQEKSPEEIERERLHDCWLERICPQCGQPVQENHINDHLGFCEERHLVKYQTEHSTDVHIQFNQARNEYYSQQYAQKNNGHLGNRI